MGQGSGFKRPTIYRTVSFNTIWKRKGLERRVSGRVEEWEGREDRGLSGQASNDPLIQQSNLPFFHSSFFNSSISLHFALVFISSITSIPALFQIRECEETGRVVVSVLYKMKIITPARGGH
jgi:hypothetical protein